MVTDTGPAHPEGQPLTNVYDPVGNRTELQSWFGSQAASFTARNELRRLERPDGTVSTWEFDAAGQMVARCALDGSMATVGYEGNGQLLGVVNKDAGGTVLDQALMAYDAVGNPLLKVTLDSPHIPTRC
jgi:YD repeat-containing protein